MYVAVTVLACIGSLLLVSWYVRVQQGYLPDEDHQCIVGAKKQINGLTGRGCLDVWHVLHVLLWALIGVLAPNHVIAALLTSIAWETFEHFIFARHAVFACTSLFCGRIEDVFLNMFGYAIGSAAALVLL